MYILNENDIGSVFGGFLTCLCARVFVGRYRWTIFSSGDSITSEKCIDDCCGIVRNKKWMLQRGRAGKRMATGFCDIDIDSIDIILQEE